MPEKTIHRVPQGIERRMAERLTGRYLMSYAPDAHDNLVEKLHRAGFPGAARLPKSAKTAKPLPKGGHYALKHVGVAVIDPHSESEAQLLNFASRERAVKSLIPEGFVRVAGRAPSAEYARGWRDATVALTDAMLETHGVKPASFGTGDGAVPRSSWGLEMTHALASRQTGAGIKIAVIDTGLDLSHPDFARRPNVEHKNLVGDEQEFGDEDGHGTHCAGIAAGPVRPSRGPRYGVAPGVALLAIRVVPDGGEAVDGTVIQAIDYAVAQGCSIISISLSKLWLPSSPPCNAAYEAAAARALARNCLVIAAAGNDYGQGGIGAIGAPGNSPSVLTVAAIEPNRSTWPNSNRATSRAPGVKGPDCAAPGADIYSSWSHDSGDYYTVSGTSQATAFVAGLAALLAQSNSAWRGRALKSAVKAHCTALGTNREGEVGAGLVLAP